MSLLIVGEVLALFLAMLVGVGLAWVIVRLASTAAVRLTRSLPSTRRSTFDYARWFLAVVIVATSVVVGVVTNFNGRTTCSDQTVTTTSGVQETKACHPDPLRASDLVPTFALGGALLLPDLKKLRIAGLFDLEWRDLRNRVESQERALTRLESTVDIRTSQSQTQGLIALTTPEIADVFGRAIAQVVGAFDEPTPTTVAEVVASIRATGDTAARPAVANSGAGPSEPEPEEGR